MKNHYNITYTHIVALRKHFNTLEISKKLFITTKMKENPSTLRNIVRFILSNLFCFTFIYNVSG